MHAYHFITCAAINSSQTLLLLHHILLHHMHCSHFITCTAITSSHTLLLLHHMHRYYSTTGTLITPSHALLLLPHMHCSHFTTGTTITSPNALLSLFHMHCDAGGNRSHAHWLRFFFDEKRKRKRQTHPWIVIHATFPLTQTSPPRTGFTNP